MADRRGMQYTKVGRHHGKNAVAKLAGLYLRAMQLRPVVARGNPLLGVSHGSRAQSILCNLLRIPNVIIADYEHAKFLPFMGPDWEIVPDVIPDEALYCRKERILKYPGIKEDVYVPRFKPDASILQELGLDEGDIIITARPPASEAHYRNPESDVLFSMFMEKALATPRVRIVLLPRNARQAESLCAQWAAGFNAGRILIPPRAVDGLNLLWHSDLAVSGGGTMNREAAALGVPVYSVFKGAIGAVDRHLAAEGRLTLIESRHEIASKLALASRMKTARITNGPASALQTIVAHIEEILSVSAFARAA
jgi:predicted glycosyltransferase